MIKRLISIFMYDKADHKLLSEIDDILSGAHSRKHLQRLFDPALHPRGIKELAAAREIRIVYAMLKLLDAREGLDGAELRVNALRTLRDELMNGTDSSLRINTARVLLQTVKELTRSGNSYTARLRLAHNLRMALTGQPRFIRRQLRAYHLLEMPEDWTQLAFDDHVHDANTKGRKTPTHLIMDAWIKGIRRLQVIYYNHVPPVAADELLRAAELMKISVRIGVELPSLFNGKFVEMIWTPRGFTGSTSFMAFLDKAEMKKFTEKCLDSSAYVKSVVLAQLKEFNANTRVELNEVCGVTCPPLTEKDFLDSVGMGQPSMLHLSQFISNAYFKLIAEDPLLKDNQRLYFKVHHERIMNHWLNDAATEVPPHNLNSLPEMMRLSPAELCSRLGSLPAGCRLTLNLSNITLDEAVEIIYDCRGAITHLELFNLKDYIMNKKSDAVAVNEFRLMLNAGNIIRLKQIVLGVLAVLEAEPHKNKKRVAKMREILRELPQLIEVYSSTQLSARFGSDSTGRYERLYGMGMVVIDSLPVLEQARIKNGGDRVRKLLPVNACINLCRRYTPVSGKSRWKRFIAELWRGLGSPFGFGYSVRQEWELPENAIAIGDFNGNVCPLGGYGSEHKNETALARFGLVEHWNCLNSRLKMFIKVMIGFIPAFISFMLTKDWWFLCWGGAFIWLGITGVRNIIQAVLGGGGFRRRGLLRWNDFVSWQRIADSLMYTGISVPLLDYVIKTLFMEQLCGLTAETNPLLVFTAINIANGFYISAHNLFRGLPRTAVYGNFFRAGLAIPLSMAFSILLELALSALGVSGIAGILQQWAAIISKIASDCVAGLIEGYADRVKNIEQRIRDYRNKILQLFSSYSSLDVMFPEDDTLKLLQSPKQLFKNISTEGRHLEHQLIVNSLDMLYFGMYQPQARNTFKRMMNDMSPDERRIIACSQKVLERRKEISQMFIDGLVGKDFARALSFYLNYHQRYLRDMAEFKAIENN
ncbi:MAG: hypothetical protein JXR78_17980 [Victivallales bacterium]|nr:hypothetical protein [Victivallales bacterium]